MKTMRTPVISFMLVITLLGGLSLPSSGQIFGLPAFDPKLEWRTLETEHFRIHFHQGLEGVAHEAALIAEESYQIIQDEFGQAPAKLDMFFVDAFDFSNGFSNPIADQVGIFTSQYRLSDWSNMRLDSWWRMVIFHELVHAVDLDQTRGISQVLRAIFGKIVLPNLMKPVPFIEGLAVYEKYKHLGESRLNDSRTRMMIRQMILDNQLPSFDEIQGAYDRSEWPSIGLLWYNYGSWLMRYVEEKYGKDALAKFDSTNVQKPLNLLSFNGLGFGENLDRVLCETLGVSTDRLYQGFREWLREQFSPELEKIQGENLTGAVRVSILGFNTAKPAWSPDGKWIAYRHSGPGRAGLRLITPQGEEDHEIVPGGTASYPAWSPDSKSLIYSKLDYDSPYYIKNDLYRYDLEAQREERLTWGERAYYAKFSPDGQKIYYAKNIGRDGSTALAVLDVKTREIHTIKEFPDNTGIIHSFALSPDSHEIALALWRRGGYQDIYLMPTAGGELTLITQDKNQDSDPTWSPDGKYILFSSDPDRIYNLYAYRLEDATLFRVTNMLTGAFYPTISPDGNELAFESYSSQGYDVYRMSFDPQIWKLVEISKETIPAWKGYPTTQYPIRPYNPWPLMIPKFWLPTPLLGGFGVVTAGFDPLFKHIYSVVAGWDFMANVPFYMLSYTNNEFIPVTFYATGETSGSSQGLSASVPLSLSLDRQQWLEVGYERSQRELNDETERPGVPLTLQTLSGSYRFTHGRQQDLFGNRLQLSVSGALTHVAESNEWRKTFVLNWREAFRLPIQTSQQLALRFVGGWTDAKEEDAEFKLGGPYGQFVLRGFGSGAFSGQQAISLGVQYDFPLFSIDRGLGRWPLFFDDLGAHLFVDAGMAGDRLSLPEIKLGFGVELQLSLTLGYFEQLGLIVGVAQGLGQSQPVFYLNAAIPGLF